MADSSYIDAIGLTAKRVIPPRSPVEMEDKKTSIEIESHKWTIGLGFVSTLVGVGGLIIAALQIKGSRRS